MSARIPESKLPRIVIIGAGFGGLKLARILANKPYQIVLVDKHNFHQFQPLFYQVATAGLAPSAIAFPIRKLFHQTPNVHFRMVSVLSVNTMMKSIETDIGTITFDKLVIATGADTNYFGNTSIQKHAFPMKSIEESLQLRNRILQCMEAALVTDDDSMRKALMNIVIVGGGPTGVEVAGALAEMKDYILPKDYPELDFNSMQINLLEAGPKILGAMSEEASKASEAFLSKMGVTVLTSTAVKSYDGHQVEVEGKPAINSETLIWAAGIKGNMLNGIDPNLIVRGGRISTDEFNEVKGIKDVFAIGDIASMECKKYPKGHPQVAQVAMQQANTLGKNLLRDLNSKTRKPFVYGDYGSMATIGRSKAVADLPGFHFNGFFAWLFWLFVHLMNILGVKNKFFIFVDWMWYYLSFDQSLRLVIKQKSPDENIEADKL
jgi:NADH:ubiquinone reductase (H+-translocating)